MRIKSWILAVLLFCWMAPAEARKGGDTLDWLCQQLGGQWSALAGGPAAAAGPAETSLKHQGSGVFRVRSAGASGVLGRWNGRQVRVNGPVRTDGEGWTYFTVDGEPCRIGRRQDGMKVFEIHFEDPSQRLELTQR